MSLIGPRPLLVKYLPYYNNEERLRHNVRPGLSGLAQVNGRNAISWEEKFKFDVMYVKKVTFIGDVKIILETVKKAFIKSEGITLNALEDFDEYRKKSSKYPVFVKPARGSASIAISKVYDKETIELLFKHDEGLMIQEFLDGQEIGADVYIDMISGEIVSIFTKKKILMRAGETDKAVSFKDEKLMEVIKKFVSEAG